MNKVYEYGKANLIYCNSEEYEKMKEYGLDFSALLCAKHPYHKQIVGYEKNCPKEHFEYLFAYRPKEHIMALNMVDAPKLEYFSDEMIIAGIDFIHAELAQQRDVVVVCNKGESRSPTMCLMFMMLHGDFEKEMTHSQVFRQFSKVATNWNPNNGILQYCVKFWDRVKRGEFE